MKKHEIIRRAVQQNTADEEKILQAVLRRREADQKTRMHYPVRRAVAVAIAAVMLVTTAGVGIYLGRPEKTSFANGPATPGASQQQTDPGAAIQTREVKLLRFASGQTGEAQTGTALEPGIKYTTPTRTIELRTMVDEDGILRRSVAESMGEYHFGMQAQGLVSVTFSCEKGIMEYINFDQYGNWFSEGLFHTTVPIDAKTLESFDEDYGNMKAYFEQYLKENGPQEVIDQYFENGLLKDGYTFGCRTETGVDTQCTLIIRDHKPESYGKTAGKQITVTQDMMSQEDRDSGMFCTRWNLTKEMWQQIDDWMAGTLDNFSLADLGTDTVTATCRFDDGTEVVKQLLVYFDVEGRQVMQLQN